MKCDSHHNKCPEKKRLLGKIVEKQWSDLSLDQRSKNARGLLGGDIIKPENAIYREKARKSMISNGRWFSEEDRTEYQNYRIKVRRLTTINFKLHQESINPDNLPRSRTWHIDHIYSIADGFINKVPPEVISHPNNLRMMYGKDNQRKNRGSDISLEELYQKVKLVISNQKDIL